MHAESIGVTALSRICPVLEGSGRDADPFQRQLLGPFVRAKSKRQGSHVDPKNTESRPCFRGCCSSLMLLLTLASNPTTLTAE